MTDDTELLRRYVESRSEADFRALVERHLGLVYHAARRRMDGRADLAEDVCQQVFTTLAHEAPKLVSHPALIGWLFLVTRHAANQLSRTERRRRRRETDAVMSSMLENSGTYADWDAIGGELDAVMDELPERDRTVILLRFFHQQPFAEVGRALGLSEDSARKRVARALDKLRNGFARRGITSSAAVLAACLTQQATAAVPAGLAQSIATTALLPGAAAALPISELAVLVKTKTTLTLVGTLGLAGLLSLPTLGLALYYHRQASQFAATVAATNHEIESRAAHLKLWQGQASDAKEAVAGVQAELDRARSAPARSPGAGPRVTPAPANPQADAVRNGKEFLARTPEARRPLLEVARAQIRSEFEGFYRAAAVPPAKIEELEARSAQLFLEPLAITPESITSTQTELPSEQMREILGEDLYPKYVEYERSHGAYGIARDSAVQVGVVTTPLSVTQTEALERVIQENSAAYQNGGTLDLRNVDWATVIEQTRTFLTPEQWRAAIRPFLGEQIDSAIVTGRSSAAEGKARKP